MRGEFMKKWLSPPLRSAGLLLACALMSGLAAETARFEWATRPELSPDQQELLRLHHSLQILEPQTGAYAEALAGIERLARKLGTNQLRPAKPYELLGKPTGATNGLIILNPTTENLAFDVSVRGDKKQMGTRMASIARTTWLPPGGVLVLTNFYWSTPAFLAETNR